MRGAAEALTRKMENRRLILESKTALSSRPPRMKKNSRVSSRVEKKAQEGLDDYLILLNALAVLGDGIVDPDDKDKDGDGEERQAGWVFVDGDGGGLGSNEENIKAKRRILRLEDVKAEYQAELDNREKLEAGKWAIFGMDGVGEEEGEGEGEEDEVEMEMEL